MSLLPVYVAAPNAAFAIVRDLHTRMRALGILPTSTWAEEMFSPERLDVGEAAKWRDVFLRNEQDMDRAVCLLALTFDAGGRTMWAEVEHVRQQGKPVLWVGDVVTLLAFAPRVVRTSLEDALVTLGTLAELARIQGLSNAIAEMDRLVEMAEGPL